MFGTPFSSPHWPKSADRAAYKAIADRSTVPDSRKDELAKAMAMIDAGSRHFIAVPHAGLGAAIVHVDDLPVADPSHLRRAA